MNDHETPIAATAIALPARRALAGTVAVAGLAFVVLVIFNVVVLGSAGEAVGASLLQYLAAALVAARWLR